jgi:hypothetical protein
MSEHNHVIEKDGQVFADNVNQTISNMDAGKKEQILKNFDEFKSYLKKRIDLGTNIGLNEEHLAVVAEKIAGYLAEHEEPRNSEEKLLHELWKAGNEEQRHTLAHLLVRFAQTTH